MATEVPASLICRVEVSCLSSKSLQSARIAVLLMFVIREAVAGSAGKRAEIVDVPDVDLTRLADMIP